MEIKTTKTAVLRGKEQLTIENRALPELTPDSVLVKIKACNICTSEYGVYNGSPTRWFWATSGPAKCWRRGPT